MYTMQKRRRDTIWKSIENLYLNTRETIIMETVSKQELVSILDVINVTFRDKEVCIKMKKFCRN